MAVTVARRGASANALFIQAFDQTTGNLADAPIHVATYCGVKQNFAVIASDGSTSRGSHVTASGRLSTGNYEVVFDRKVSTCAITATIGATGVVQIASPDEITIGRQGTDNNRVLVHTMDRAGADVDVSFHLAADCGAKPDFGVVNSDGSKARGAHLVSSARLSRGRYEAIFDHDVTACSYTATVGATGKSGTIADAVTVTTASRFENVNGVFVFIHNVSGVTQDEPFHLKVTC
jgi:hypothetical protein